MNALDQLRDRLDAFGVAIRDFQVELLFNGQDEFDTLQFIESEVLNQTRVSRQLVQFTIVQNRPPSPALTAASWARENSRRSA